MDGLIHLSQMSFLDGIDSDYTSSNESDPWPSLKVGKSQMSELNDPRGRELRNIMKSIEKNDWQLLNEDTVSELSVPTPIQMQPKKNAVETLKKLNGASNSVAMKNILREDAPKPKASVKKKVVRFAQPEVEGDHSLMTITKKPRQPKSSKSNDSNVVINTKKIKNQVDKTEREEVKSKENLSKFKTDKTNAASNKPKKAFRPKAGSDKNKDQAALTERFEVKKTPRSTKYNVPKAEVDEPLKCVPSKPRKVVRLKAGYDVHAMDEMIEEQNGSANKKKRVSTVKKKTPIDPKFRVKSTPSFNIVMQEYLWDIKEMKRESEKQARIARLPRKFKCDICGMVFCVQSILEAHKRQKHEDIGISSRKAPVSSSKTTVHKCIFCGKTFARINALHIHHMRHCTKISFNEKKNLQYTELEHVQKPLVPVFNHVGSPKDHLINNSAATKSNKQVNAHDGTQEKPIVKNVIKEFSAAGDLKVNAQNLPNAAIECFLCKKRFDNVLDFSDHCKVVHANRERQARRKVKEIDPAPRRIE